MGHVSSDGRPEFNKDEYLSSSFIENPNPSRQEDIKEE